MSNQVKYRISDKNGTTLFSFYSDTPEGVLNKCRTESMKALKKLRKPLELDYQKFNPFIQDWVTFGGMKGAL